MRLFLASSSLGALGPFLAGAKRAALLPTAAEQLPDRATFVRRARTELRDVGVQAVLCDPDRVEARAIVSQCDAIAVSGGDPFHLLARLRGTGFDRVIAEAVARGVPYVGVSAGAMVAGPSLEPIVTTSPFAPAPGQALAGLGLTDIVVLPHHDRKGRAEKHADAMRRFAGRFAFQPLTNTEALVIEAGEARVVRSDRAEDDARRTWRGLRADADVPTIALDDFDELARAADQDAEAREEAKWRALFDSGLVSHESVPVLQVARDEIHWSSCDDVEVHALLRIAGGASVGAILGEAKVDRDALVRALCRLAARGVIRFA